MKLNYFFYFILTAFSIGCNKSSNEYISPDLLDQLNNVCPNSEDSNKVIYYFNGDCSVCFANMVEIEKRFAFQSNTKMIMIAKTEDPRLFNYLLEGFTINACVIITTLRS